MPYPVEQQGTPRAAITPTIGGTPVAVVAINGGAAAGSKHINDATPTAAETLPEQIRWDFSSADDVRKVQIGLNVQGILVTALSGTAGEVVKSHEVAYLKVTVNPGDDVIAATRLANGYPEVFFVYPGETIEVESDTAITAVYAIAALATGTVLQGGATVDCKGVSYV